MSNKANERLGAVTVLIGGCLACCVLLRWATPVLRAASTGVAEPHRSPVLLVEQTVLLLTAAALVALCSWLLIGVLATSACVLLDRAGDAGGLLCPKVVTALVASALGAAVSAGGYGAHASGPRGLPEALDGLTLPDRTYGGVRTHEVTPGESLWSITSELLPAGATPGAIAAAWPRLHRLNVDRVGTNPDVLHPGTDLRLPARASVPTRGAPR